MGNMATSTTTDGSDGYGRFGTLPQELRNEIYHHALVAQGAIIISSGKRNKAMVASDTYFTGTKEGCRSVRSRVSIKRGEQQAPPSEGLAIGLVGASKAIRKEAATILYGSNHFATTTAYTLGDFLYQIGMRVASLTRIKLLISRKNPNWAHLHDLRRMAKPHVIKVPARDVRETVAGIRLIVACREVADTTGTKLEDVGRLVEI